MNEIDRRAEQIAYLQHCVSENLNHARHVENERLTFTSIYIAMVIGAVAVVFGLENNVIAAIVAGLLAAFGLVSAKLNERWQGVFDDHMKKAAACDTRWCTLIGQEEPCYLYGNYSPDKHHKIHEGRTRKIFKALYWSTFAALALLTAYLILKATQSTTGGGFYFTEEVVSNLEEAIGRIVEETKK